MIYTTYFDNVKNLDENIIPIAICGKCPDSWNGLKYPKLAPKKGFWLEWEKNKDNNFYEKHFKKEVLDNFKDIFECLDGLFDILPEDVRESLEIVNCPFWENPNIHIALVCFEKSNEFCHRFLVSKWINESLGYELVKEWSPYI